MRSPVSGPPGTSELAAVPESGLWSPGVETGWGADGGGTSQGRWGSSAPRLGWWLPACVRSPKPLEMHTQSGCFIVCKSQLKADEKKNPSGHSVTYQMSKAKTIDHLPLCQGRREMDLGGVLAALARPRQSKFEIRLSFHLTVPLLGSLLSRPT